MENSLSESSNSDSDEEDTQTLKFINQIPYIPSDVKRFRSHVARLNTTVGSIIETMEIPKVPFMDWFYGTTFSLIFVFQ